jgi:hypothetical protein
MTKMVSHLPAVEVGDEVAASVANGRSMEVSEDMAGSFRVEGGGEFLAVYEAGGGVARPEVVLCAS